MFSEREADTCPRRGSSLLGEWGAAVPSELAGELEARRISGAPLIDLVAANPQLEGFEFPPPLLASILELAREESRYYQPDPRGQSAARDAIAEYHGQGLDPAGVLLTPGTSLGYFYAFRLLAELGDEVLVPSPTYPLFDDLAAMAGLSVRRYHLNQEGGRWVLDPQEIEFQLTPRTRLIAVVSPHNPTGAIASAGELASLAEIARRHRLAIVFDEVFREFVHGDTSKQAVRRPAEFGAPLLVTLNGLSKMLALPGIKAGWMVVEGEDRAWCRRLLCAAEYLSDTLLPVSELTQAAIPRLLREGQETVRRNRELCGRRMMEFAAAWHNAGVEVQTPEGGPYLPLRLPLGYPRHAEEEIALRLVRDHGILIHPGKLYAMPEPSLITTCIRRPPWPVDRVAEEMGRLRPGERHD